MPKELIDIDDPVHKKAFELAAEFANHCLRNDLPETFIIYNVSFSATELIEKSFNDGVIAERERLAALLHANNITYNNGERNEQTNKNS